MSSIECCGIQSRYHLVNRYKTDGNRSVRIKTLEKIIKTVFSDDDVKKCCLVQNAQKTGLVDTVFEALD
jgi:hypothetical protein